MKVYVVTARYCEDEVVCGVALDESTAAKIVECEEKTDGIQPDYVDFFEYDTDDYLPLNVGAVPYEVLFYPAEERWGVEAKTVATRCGMSDFVRNAVGKTRRGGIDCMCCYVYAMNEEHAIEKATALLEKEQKNTK